MALTTCYECDTQVSTRAKACPKCGAPVSEGLGIGAPAKMLVGFAVILLGVLAMGGMLGQSDRKAAEAEQVRIAALTPEEQAAEKEAAALKAAVYACRNSISEKLRDPDSADFEPTSESYRARDENGLVRVQVDGRAKNGFGGYNRSTWECVLVSTDDINWLPVTVKELR